MYVVTCVDLFVTPVTCGVSAAVTAGITQLKLLICHGESNIFQLFNRTKVRVGMYFAAFTAAIYCSHVLLTKNSHASRNVYCSKNVDSKKIDMKKLKCCKIKTYE